MSGVVIAGAGQAGAQAAISLRQGGYPGPVTLIGDEPDLPYERPPLSKDYLRAGADGARLQLRPAAFWAERAVDWRGGTAVTRVDAAARTVTAGGETLAYEQLIWAAGGHARTLPGAEMAGVHVIRTRAGTDALRADLAGAADVVIVGGGYIGLEAAAVLVGQGKRVTVVELAGRVLARVTCEQLSRFYEGEHRARGVRLLTGTALLHLEARDGRVCAVHTSAGVFPAQVVIAGVGLVPHGAALADAGAAVEDGVHVDAFCRTSLAHVYAIGDCANHANAYAGGARIRLESVQNAIDMAKTAAAHILGVEQPYRAVPWFWSNQFDLKLQTVGLHGRHDEVVVRGRMEDRSFSLIYRHAGRVIALDCVNAPRDFVAGKALVEAGCAANAGALADVGVALKSLASL